MSWKDVNWQVVTLLGIALFSTAVFIAYVGFYNVASYSISPHAHIAISDVYYWNGTYTAYGIIAFGPPGHRELHVVNGSARLYSGPMAYGPRVEWFELNAPSQKVEGTLTVGNITEEFRFDVLRAWAATRDDLRRFTRIVSVMAIVGGVITVAGLVGGRYA